MKVEPTSIPEVLVVTPPRFADHRGFFSETFRQSTFDALGVVFVQDNQSLSRQRGTIRGLHFQTAPAAQGKLVRVTRGALLDVAVDIRKGSPSFGKHVAVELSAENWRQLWIPPGFAHGLCTLTDDCEVVYKVTAYYDAACDKGLAFDDPALSIDWKIDPGQAVVSEKDRHHPRLAELPTYFSYGDQQ